MRAKQAHVFNRFVFALSLFGCLVVAACASAGAPTIQVTPPVATPAFAAKHQPLLVAKMQQLRIPGAIIYVDLPGQGSWTTALGTSDLATHAPMNVNSHMRIASITKTLTATAILQLVDAGKLRLDDPVSAYQPQVPNGVNITIRELLNMTSGLFNLLGLIIEQLTHQPVEQVFQQRIFTPLGMNGSSLPPATDASIPDPHPHLYMFGTLVEIFTSPRLSSEEAAKANATAGTPQDVTFWSLSQAWTGGSAISTVHDLKIWAKALATGKLLSAAAHQEQLSFTPQSNGAYGLGVANFGGFLGHNGADPGLQSWMGYQPQKGATIVVLTNLFLAPDRSSLPADQLAGIIQQELFA